MPIALALAITALVGAALQTSNFTPPGQLIDVGGRRIHLYCTGAGNPTVVFVPGAASFSIDFALVQTPLSRTTRVCAFDRAGYAWSDPFKVDDAEQVVRDLRTALANAGEPSPWLLVGQSLGSRHVRLFHARYPSEVAAIVLIDGEHEDGLFVGVNGKPVPISSLTEKEFAAATPPASPPPQAVPEPRLEPAYERLPESLQQMHLWLLTRFFEAMRSATAAEVDAFRRAEHEALVTLHRIDSAPRPLGNLPLVVLSRGANSSPLHQRLQTALAELSSNSKHIVVPGADHELHLFRPDVVVAGILDAIKAYEQQRSAR
jgi:pimeloyl-ACP methyl ester carboxylesterase